MEIGEIYAAGQGLAAIVDDGTGRLVSVRIDSNGSPMKRRADLERVEIRGSVGGEEISSPARDWISANAEDVETVEAILACLVDGSSEGPGSFGGPPAAYRRMGVAL